MMSAQVGYDVTCVHRPAPLHNLLSHAYTGKKKVSAGNGGKKRMTQSKKHKVKISKAVRRGKRAKKKKKRIEWARISAKKKSCEKDRGLHNPAQTLAESPVKADCTHTQSMTKWSLVAEFPPEIDLLGIIRLPQFLWHKMLKMFSREMWLMCSTDIIKHFIFSVYAWKEEFGYSIKCTKYNSYAKLLSQKKKQTLEGWDIPTSLFWVYGSLWG